ncbi:carboxylating nicotinate-nucleotide diphosphorylase [Hyphomicrobium sp.]|uniref:carboxylating nicotinate-nucleotide diphosphorylase n=1 Tax=Hyphomicrobium sp. TaxID=82 RepID=UPI001DCD8AB5|nr:carboxylating nicotinate-nucleotide diphosphorylase [Hyphomicrobium sp.]MBY0562088.1 carboxylating nicotinate-nucleotide diphosphorylase [Hyphomicrobium sp.]
MTAPSSSFATLLPNLVLAAVRNALEEDLGLSGDITTDATVSPDARTVALLAARKPGIVSGLALAEAAFRELDPECAFRIEIEDGSAVAAGGTIARISGNARAILTAERVALNFMGRMCGIATLTRRYVDAVAATSARIVDTRKTTPGLRAFEKYAVRCGGGHNHRFGLFDAVLIKDNHIVAAGGIEAAIKAAKATAGHMTKIEVEVDTLDQLEVVMRDKIDCVLLDNMAPAELRKAVAIVAGRCLTEASGGVNLDTVRDIAASGVDMISVGALTHSAPVLDLGLDFVTPGK